VTLVLDASVALAWIFERADATEIDQANAVLAGLSNRQTVVPALWHAEVVNALVVALRRRAVSLSKASEFLSKLDRLPMQTDDTPISSRNESIFALGRQYTLSAYDATYLDLALRTGAAFVTFDRRLMQARNNAGVPSC
jgi:predicted nucleic acid-binding protein